MVRLNFTCELLERLPESRFRGDDGYVAYPREEGLVNSGDEGGCRVKKVTQRSSPLLYDNRPSGT